MIVMLFKESINSEGDELDFQYEEAQQQITIHRMWNLLGDISFWSSHDFTNSAEASYICREKLNIPSLSFCSCGKSKHYLTCKSVLQFQLEGFNKVKDLNVDIFTSKEETLDVYQNFSYGWNGSEQRPTQFFFTCFSSSSVAIRDALGISREPNSFDYPDAFKTGELVTGYFAILYDPGGF